MKKRVAREDLVTRPLMIATPMYGGQCYGGYVHGLLNINTVMAHHSLTMEYYSVANVSLITMGRNLCAHKFLNSDCTHLLFIDADVPFTADDVISLLALADPLSDKDIICGLVPKKHIDWNKITTAVLRGTYGDALAACGTNLNFNPIEQRVEFDSDALFEVVNTGAGFMMIQRKVFEGLSERFPDKWYLDEFEKAKMLDFFGIEVDENRMYLSEDFCFCKRVRDIGCKIWVAPWLELDHLGPYRFKGNLQAHSMPAIETAA